MVWVLTVVILLITCLITTQEPPSTCVNIFKAQSPTPSIGEVETLISEVPGPQIVRFPQYEFQIQFLREVRSGKVK